MSPRHIFSRIGQAVGLKWEDEMLDLSQEGHHMVSGNLSRINAHKINPPSKECLEMNEFELSYIKKNTGKVLARLARKIF